MSASSPEHVGPWAVLIADIIARGYSEHDLAAIVTDAAWDLDKVRTTVHASTISRWLTGSVARPRLRRWLAHGLKTAKLDIPLERINAAADAQEQAKPTSRQWPAALPVAVHQPDGPVDSDDVKRRAFTQLVAQAGLGLVTAGWGVDTERWSATLSGTRLDASLVDGMEALTSQLMQQAPTIPPTSLLPAVRGHLQGLRESLLWTPPALAARLRSVAGQTALLAGYLMLQAENRPEADACWALALRLAEVAGDDRLRAALLVHQAWRWEDDDLPHSRGLLDHAASLLGPAPDPAIAVMVLSVRGSKRAQLSRADQAFAVPAMRDLEAAQTSLSRLHPREDGLYVFGSVTGQATESRGWALLDLARPHDAVADLTQRLASIDPSSLAWRSYATSGLAAAIASMGDPEHASELLSTSLEFAGNASSPRCAKVAGQTRNRWLAGYDGPAVRRFDQHLREISPSTGGAPTGDTTPN
jgi:hypothetical protein